MDLCELGLAMKYDPAFKDTIAPLATLAYPQALSRVGILVGFLTGISRRHFSQAL